MVLIILWKLDLCFLVRGATIAIFELEKFRFINNDAFLFQFVITNNNVLCMQDISSTLLLLPFWTCSKPGPGVPTVYVCHGFLCVPICGNVDHHWLNFLFIITTVIYLGCQPDYNTVCMSFCLSGYMLSVWFSFICFVFSLEVDKPRFHHNKPLKIGLLLYCIFVTAVSIF